MNPLNSSRLIEIFADAVDCKLEERAAFLDKACGEDASLRTRVDELLVAHSKASGIFDGSQTLQMTEPNLEAGTTIGPYSLVRLIGEGGFGNVHLAVQSHPIERQVALKIVKPGMAGEAVVQRFNFERKSLALMNHPNIAQIYDGGTTDDNVPYIAMEFVDGGGIVEYCSDNHLSVRERLELFVGACNGVEHAHQKGVIHRDIKPNNVLVANIDGRPVPKVIDFGVAKALAGSTEEPLTIARQLIGTPAYMSPEQASFDQDDIDTRSDVYSLGILLYELLTNTTPFIELYSRVGYREIMRVIRDESPVPPSKKLTDFWSDSKLQTFELFGQSKTKVLSQIRGELDWIVLKAIRKQRDERYQSARELGEDVQRYLAGHAVKAVPPGAFYHMKKFAWKHRYACTGALVMLSSLLVSLLISLNSIKTTKQQLKQSEELLSYMAEVFDGFAPATDMKSFKGNSVTDLKIVDQAFDALKSSFHDNPETKARLLTAVGGSYLGLGEPEKLLETIEMRSSLGFEDEIKTGIEPVKAARARAFYVLGRWKESANISEQLLPKVKEALGENDPVTINLERNFANALGSLGQTEKALPLLESIHRKASGESQHAITHDLALAFRRLNRVDDAIDLLEKQVKTLGQDFGVDAYHVVQCRKLLAVSYADVGRVEEAVKIQEPNLQTAIERFTKKHDATLNGMYNMALIYSKAQRHDEAIKLSAELVKLRSEKSGPYNRITFHTRIGYAIAYKNAERYAESCAMFEAICNDMESELGPGDPFTINTQIRLSANYLIADQRDKALAVLKKAFDIASKHLGLDHPTTKSVKSAYEEAQ